MKLVIPIAKFKAHCHKIIEEAQNSNHEVILTKNGKAIASITPVSEKKLSSSIFGKFIGRAIINGDITKSLETNWNAETSNEK